MRIYVEWVIELVGQNYKSLNGILPSETLYCNNSTPQIDKLAIVCCSPAKV